MGKLTHAERCYEFRNRHLPRVGNTVDPLTATYTDDVGDGELKAVWVDPAFDPDVPAFYYVRVLESPRPRWATHDAVMLGRPLRDDVPASLQERALTSPIWNVPEG